MVSLTWTYLAVRSFDPTRIHCESALQSRQVMLSWHVPYVRCSCIGDIDFASAGVCHTLQWHRYQLFWSALLPTCALLHSFTSGPSCAAKQPSLALTGVEPHLQEPSHSTGDVLAIRAEARRSNWLLECEMVQQCPALTVDQQGAAVLVYRQQKLTVRADTNRPDLQDITLAALQKPTAVSRACHAVADEKMRHHIIAYMLSVLKRQR